MPLAILPTCMGEHLSNEGMMQIRCMYVVAIWNFWTIFTLCQQGFIFCCWLCRLVQLCSQVLLLLTFLIILNIRKCHSRFYTIQYLGDFIWYKKNTLYTCIWKFNNGNDLWVLLVNSEWLLRICFEHIVCKVPAVYFLQCAFSIYQTD